MAMSAYDEFLSAEDLRRERVAEDAARAARRAETYQQIRDNLRVVPRSAAAEAAWQGAMRAADHAILDSPDGFGALARMLMRLSDRLSRIESRLGLLEEASHGE